MMRVLWSSLLVVLFVAGSSACTDGDTAAVDGKCREYQVCKNGTWAKDSCNTPLRKFDKKQKKCMWWFQVDCAEATQCTEGELRKNPYTCSSYYTCSNGKLESNHCFWPFFFDGERCKFWGDCKSSATEEKYAEECSGDEVEPIADSPRQYKTCKDGFFEQTSCWLGKKFDVDTKTCEWFWKVKSDVTACDGKARTTDKSGGKTYYQCNDKILLKKSCGLLQIFDAEQGRCVFSVKSINLNAVNDSVKMEDAAEAIKNVKGVYFTSMAGAEKKSDHPESTKTIDPALSYKTNVARVLRSIRNSYLMDSSCTDGSTQAALNCLSYKTCIGNTWVTRSCPDGQIFSNGQCTWQWKAQCNPGSCITGQKTAYIPDCKKYLLCDEKNNEVVKECTQHFWETQHFNPSSGKCEMVLPWASCPSSSYAVTCSEGQTIEGSNPSEFQICSNSRWVKVKCAGSDVYKKDLNGCGCPEEAEHKTAQNPKQYLECQGGRWIQLDCLLGGVFNPTTKVCEKARSKRSVEAAKNPNDCISGDTKGGERNGMLLGRCVVDNSRCQNSLRFKADVMTGVCSTYMFCAENGKWARRACPAGEYYNGHNGCGKDLCPYVPVPGDCESFVTASGMKETCDFGFRFDSTSRQCVPFAQASCLEIECEGTERKNHPTSCSKYLQCHNQQWETNECGWFHNEFDMNSRECVFSWWGNKATCRYDPTKCTEGSVSPVAGDCRRYLACSDGREHERSCKWLRRFDQSSSRCVWWGAKCA